MRIQTKSTAGAIIAAVILSLSLSSPAMADESEIAQMGIGHTDVSELNIVGIEPQTTGETTGTELVLAEGTVTAEEPLDFARTTNPACEGRIDYYRMIDDEGRTYCFAYAGTISRGGTAPWLDIRYLCPGNNQGRVYYKRSIASGDNNFYYSTWRGKETNFNTCYDFGANTYATVTSVQIR